MHGIDSADVQARLRRKLQRELQRQESARLAAEAAALADEAELRALAVSSAHALNAYSGAPALRDTLEHAAAAHTQAATARALAATARALDAGAQLEAAREALAAPPPPRAAARLDGDPEADAEAARRARLARLLHPPRPPAHAQPWSALRADPLALGTARVCAGTGATDPSRVLPATHGDGGAAGPAWLPSARSHEVTLPHPARAPGATGTGTWAGHGAIDAPARGTARGLVSTARPSGGDGSGGGGGGEGEGGLPQLQALLRATTGSLQRFPHDPIPSHVLPAAAFAKARSAGGGSGAPLPLPRALLNTLTRPQLLAPRHPAYLLDSNLHHSAAWRRPVPAAIKTFSEPPRAAPPTLNELRRAAVAMVPERSLPASDPIHAGKPAYCSAVHAPPLFSRAPLDSAWEEARRAEEEAAREGVFWRAAAVMEAGGEGSAGGGGGGGGGDDGEPLQLLPAHLAGPSPSPMRHASRATGEATFRTFSASGMHGEALHGGLGGTLGRSSSSAGGGGGSALGGGGGGSSSSSDAPALSLLTGPQGKFQALRSALVFGSAGAAREYEAARRSLVARKAMGAKAAAAAEAEVEAGLAALEGRLAARGVSAGLGATGNGSASARGAAMAARVKQALEP
jgi:hypothetical protein